MSENNPPDGRGWNDLIIAECRANGGYAAWSSEEQFAAGRPVPPWLPWMSGVYEERGMPLLLVHHIGAKTGRARISPLFFQPVGDGWAVFGTHGGSPHDPVWFHNLMANPKTTVETGAETVPVVARLAEGKERERIWARQVEVVPKFAEFEATSGRQIPVVVLERAECHEGDLHGPQVHEGHPHGSLSERG